MSDWSERLNERAHVCSPGVGLVDALALDDGVPGAGAGEEKRRSVAVAIAARGGRSRPARKRHRRG